MRGLATPPPVATAQDGVFTAAQAVEAGWTTWQVRRRRSEGAWLTVVGRGLISRDLVDKDDHGRVVGFPPRVLARAAQLTWPDAIGCRRTAAGVHGLPVAPSITAEVLVGPGRRPSSGLRPYTRPPHLEPLILPGGLRITDRLRTALDCLAHLPFDEALDLFAWLSTREILARPQVEAEANEQARRPGAVQLRRLLVVTRDGAVSSAEYRFHRLLREGGLTGWVAGARITGADGRTVVVDVAFPAERLLVEIDGERAHRGRDAFVRDRRRQNALVGAGYTVLRFTWWDLTQRPDAVIAEIRRNLTMARARV